MTSAAITTEIQKLEPSAIVELFEMDATDFGGDLLRFHAGTNGLTSSVVWQGNTYTPYPIKATGFDFTGNGQLPRPKLTVSNVTGAITLLVLTYDDLLGAKITRKRTMVKYLDAVNFPDSTNPDADDTAEFPDDVFFIDRKATETRDVVEFELAASFDVAGVLLPRRQIIQNVCVWKYKGTECGFVGGKYVTGTYEIQSSFGFKTLVITASAHGFAAGEALYFYPTSGLGSVTALSLVAKTVTTNTISVPLAANTAAAGTGSCKVTQLFDANDAPVFSSSGDVCGKRLSSCKLRFGAEGALSFGSFPSAGLVR